MESALKNKFAGKNVQISAQSTDGITGYFEWTVNGQLVHSKKGGNGFVDTQDKMDRLVAVIEAELAKA